MARLAEISPRAKARITGVFYLLTILLGGVVGWLTCLAPPFADRVYPYVVAIGLVGALAQIGWLLVVGVDEERRKDRARGAATSIWA